jgi:hypothetical protein
MGQRKRFDNKRRVMKSIDVIVQKYISGLESLNRDGISIHQLECQYIDEMRTRNSEEMSYKKYSMDVLREKLAIFPTSWSETTRQSIDPVNRSAYLDFLSGQKNQGQLSFYANTSVSNILDPNEYLYSRLVLDNEEEWFRLKKVRHIEREKEAFLLLGRLETVSRDNIGKNDLVKNLRDVGRSHGYALTKDAESPCFLAMERMDQDILIQAKMYDFPLIKSRGQLHIVLIVKQPVTEEVLYSCDLVRLFAGSSWYTQQVSSLAEVVLAWKIALSTFCPDVATNQESTGLSLV